MDNDDKVNSGTEVGHSKVQIFLQDSLNAIRQDEQKTYDLHEEFAKTRQNKDYFVVKIIAAVVVLVALVSWAVTSAINESSRNVKVDIAVFDDINLRNALDMAKKAEDKLSSAQQSRKDIQSDLESDLAALSLKKQSESDIIANQRLGDADRKAKLSALDAQYAAKRKALNASYASKLAAADQAVANAQKEINSFDQKRVEEARKQKQVLDNQQDLFELEKKKMTDAYESELADLRKKVDAIQKENALLKTAEIKNIMDQYQAKIDGIDPSFGDPAGADYVSSVQAVDADVPFRAAPDNIPKGFEFGEKDFASVARNYSGVDLLLGKVAGLPYEHDVGTYAASARKLAFVAGSANEKIIVAAFTRIGSAEAKLATARSSLAQASADRDSAIKSVGAYESALTAFGTANDYAGYIIAMRVVEPPAPAVPAAEDLPADQAKLLDTAAVGGDAPSTGNPDATAVAAASSASSDSPSAAEPSAPASEPSAPPVLVPEIYFVGTAIDAAFTSDKPVAYVYRAPKTLIATLSLTRSDTGAVIATVAKMEKNKEIQPLDFISVKKR